MGDAPAPAVPISIVGLPASGKTTFLAALWELVQEDRITKCLRFHSIGDSDHAYLGKIVRVWRSAKEQERTELTGMTSVSLTLQNEAGRVARVTIPDVPGEAFRSMWEDRDVEEALAESLGAGNIMLLLHGNRIRSPAWVTERAAQRRTVKDQEPAGLPEKWHPRHAPTQVALVDVLQHIARPPLGITGRKVAVMISAWDKVEGERLRPGEFLRVKLPLLAQYLAAGRDGWDHRIYGVSAQGGEYDENHKDKAAPKKKADAERLRDVDVAAERIRLVSDDCETHDLTRPLQWLMT